MIDEPMLDLIRAIAFGQATKTAYDIRWSPTDIRIDQVQIKFFQTDKEPTEQRRLDVELALDILRGNEAALHGYIDRYLEGERATKRLMADDLFANGFQFKDYNDSGYYQRTVGRFILNCYFRRDLAEWWCSIGDTVFKPLRTLGDLYRLLRVFGVEGN